ncbi:MAG: DUF5711 family protein [Eubacteriales bacterium]|jgi:hypothetical protein
MKLKSDVLSRIKKRLGIGGGSIDEIYLDSDDLAGLCNPYYARAADICQLLGYAAYALLILFILGAVLLNIRDVTYENLYYFIKDFGAVAASGDYGDSPVIYSYAENRKYSGYKGGIVTSGDGTLTVYSATGRKTAEFYTGYSNPVICASSKYILVYNLGGGEYSIYNSFVRLHTGSLENPIYSAVISDNGSFALLGSEGEYKSVIYRYNSKFEKSAAYYYNDYVISMSLSSDGRYLLVSPTGTSSAQLSSRLLLYGERSEEPVVLDGDIPGLVLSCGVECETTIGGESVFHYHATADTIFLKGRGETPCKIPLGDKELLFLDSDTGGLAAVVSDQNGYILHILPYKGEPADIRLDGKVLKIKKSGDFVFLLFSDKVARYDIKKGESKTLPCPAGAEDIVVSSSNYVYVTCAWGAMSVGFD